MPSSDIAQAFCREPVFAINQWPRAEIFAVSVEKIEQEKDESGGIVAVGCLLDDGERSDAVGAHAAELAVEIGLARIERRHGLAIAGYLCVQSSPVRVSSLTRPPSSRACMR
jgi:ribosomal protein L18E